MVTGFTTVAINLCLCSGSRLELCCHLDCRRIIAPQQEIDELLTTHEVTSKFFSRATSMEIVRASETVSHTQDVHGKYHGLTIMGKVFCGASDPRNCLTWRFIILNTNKRARNFMIISIITEILIIGHIVSNSFL